MEVEYLNWLIKRTVLFMCDWFDPTPNMGIRVHEQYNIVEINHRRRYDKYELLNTQLSNNYSRT